MYTYALIQYYITVTGSESLPYPIVVAEAMPLKVGPRKQPDPLPGPGYFLRLAF